MVKRITVIGFLLLAASFNSYAQDRNRIDRLEKEVKELKLRVSKLESLLKNQSSAREAALSSEGWKSIENWRKLSTDMDASEVKKILGEPQRVDGGPFSSWYYPNRGTVSFVRGKVTEWMEPRQ